MFRARNDAGPKHYSLTWSQESSHVFEDGAEGIGYQIADGRLLMAHQPCRAFHSRQIEVCGGHFLNRYIFHQFLDTVGGSGDGIIGIGDVLLSHQSRHELTLRTDPQFADIIELGTRLGGGHQHIVQIRHQVTSITKNQKHYERIN